MGMPILRSLLPQSQTLKDLQAMDERRSPTAIRVPILVWRYASVEIKPDLPDPGLSHPPPVIPALSQSGAMLLDLYRERNVRYLRRLLNSLQQGLALLNLVRDREEVKLDLLRTDFDIFERSIISDLMLHILYSLRKWDSSKIFHHPVAEFYDLSDYLDIIKHPMDFSTVRSKIIKLKYTTLDQFFNDLYLIPSNCKTYNSADTHFYHTAQLLEELIKEFRDSLVGGEFSETMTSSSQKLPLQPSSRSRSTRRGTNPPDYEPHRKNDSSDDPISEEISTPKIQRGRVSNAHSSSSSSSNPLRSKRLEHQSPSAEPSPKRRSDRLSTEASSLREHTPSIMLTDYPDKKRASTRLQRFSGSS